MKYSTNIFEPLLEAFLQETKTINSGYPYGPIIPHVFEQYDQAPLKVFYCGRDTYYWLEENLLSKDTIPSYLSRNASVITPEAMMDNNNLSNFWTFVSQLHLYLRTGKMADDLTRLSSQQIKTIREVGYGNLHSIELKQTLINEGTWEGINPSEYNVLVQKSKSLDKLKYILDAYEPDIVFILSWENYMEFFNGLEYENVASWYEEDLRSVFTVKGYRTKIIWTSHPHRFSFLRKDAKGMIRYLGDTAMNLLKL